MTGIIPWWGLGATGVTLEALVPSETPKPKSKAGSRRKNVTLLHRPLASWGRKS